MSAPPGDRVWGFRERFPPNNPGALGEGGPQAQDGVGGGCLVGKRPVFRCVLCACLFIFKSGTTVEMASINRVISY